MDKEIPQYSMVIFVTEVSEGFKNAYPFKKEHPYIYFGEIPNMPGHCIVMDHGTGKFFSGYHTEHFIEINEEVEKRLGW